MPKKPENTGSLNKLLNTFRAFADGLTGGARSVAQSASTTAKSAVDQASTAAATAGSVIKENPGKTAAVAGAAEFLDLDGPIGLIGDPFKGLDLDEECRWVLDDSQPGSGVTFAPAANG